MMIDPVYRLDLYGLSSKLSQRHWAHLVQEHFSDHPDVVAKAKAALTAEGSAVVQAAFGNVQYKWARERQPDGKFIDKSFDGMLKDYREGGRHGRDEELHLRSELPHAQRPRSRDCRRARQFETLGGSSSSRANWDSIAAIALWR